MKKLFGLLIIVNICLCVSCNNQSFNEIEEENVTIDGVKKIGSKISKDEIYIASENIYLHFYKNFTHMACFSIDCLSANEIDVDSLGLKIDVATPYEISVEEMVDEDFDLYSFELFSGYDNDLANELKEKNEDQYEQYNQKYLDAYNELNTEDVGELHHYVVHVYFQLSNDLSTEKFSNIQLAYNGEYFEKNIGEIIIDYSKENPKHEKSLYASCVTMADIYISNNEDGIMELEGENMYQAEKFLKITNIYMMNEDTKVNKSSFRINSEDVNYDVSWEGQGIEIDEDTEVGINAVLSRDDFKNKTCYQCSDYLLIEYKEGKNIYKTGTELYFKTKLTGYQLYAYFLDNIDLFEVEESEN